MSTNLRHAFVDRPESNVKPPDFTDVARWVKIPHVPIIDTCKRSYTKTDKNGSPIHIEESIDEDQLEVILENSRNRADRGEFGITFVGHTTDDGKEIDQPPIVGYIKDYQLGTHEGKPAILADMYLDREDCDPSKVLRQFPRRSAEIIGISKPTGYIDSVALLKRTPERPLGLLTSHFSNPDNVTRFECPSCEKENMDKSSVLADEEMRQGKIKNKKNVIKNVLELFRMLVHDVIEADDEEEKSSPDKEKAMPEVSRNRKEKPDPSDEDMSEYEETSEDSSEDDPSAPAEKNERTPKKTKMERMDPSDEDMSEESEENDADEDEEEKPSKMKKPAKSKMQAGFASPTSTVSATAGRSPVQPSTSKLSKRSSEVSRMKADEDRVTMSRFQRELAQRDTIIAELKSQLDATAREKRAAVIERKVAQLQAEGYDLKRSAEVTRLSKFSSDVEIDEEISRMRDNYRKTPVGQPLIPQLGEDLGGNNLPRPDLNYYDGVLPEESDTGIIGSHVFRFAKQNEVVANGKTSPINAAMNAVSRFRASRNN